jgi:intracellular septation protein A
MKNLLSAGKFLALDMASTLVLLAVLRITGDIMIAAGVGVAIAFAQVGVTLARRQPVHTMLWLSLILVTASASASFLTNDPRFIMVKPSIISAVVGAVMLKRGWMDRYLPPIALQTVPDIAVLFGYVWAGSMFFAAALNLVLAFRLDTVTWGTVMGVYHIASTIVLFLIQFATMRIVGAHRRRVAEAGAVPAQA